MHGCVVSGCMHCACNACKRRDVASFDSKRYVWVFFSWDLISKVTAAPLYDNSQIYVHVRVKQYGIGLWESWNVMDSVRCWGGGWRCESGGRVCRTKPDTKYKFKGMELKRNGTELNWNGMGWVWKGWNGGAREMKTRRCMDGVGTDNIMVLKRSGLRWYRPSRRQINQAIMR